MVFCAQFVPASSRWNVQLADLLNPIAVKAANLKRAPHDCCSDVALEEARAIGQQRAAELRRRRQQQSDDAPDTAAAAANLHEESQPKPASFSFDPTAAMAAMAKQGADAGSKAVDDAASGGSPVFVFGESLAAAAAVDSGGDKNLACNLQEPFGAVAAAATTATSDSSDDDL